MPFSQSVLGSFHGTFHQPTSIHQRIQLGPGMNIIQPDIVALNQNDLMSTQIMNCDL